MGAGVEKLVSGARVMEVGSEVMVEEESAGAPFEEAETRAEARAAARAAAALPMVAATLIAAP